MQLLDPARRPFLNGGPVFLHENTPPMLDRNATKVKKDMENVPDPPCVHVRHALECQLFQPLLKLEKRCLVGGWPNAHHVPPDEGEILDVRRRSEQISVRVCHPEELRPIDYTYLTKRQMLDGFSWIVRPRSGHIRTPGFGISR